MARFAQKLGANDGIAIQSEQTVEDSSDNPSLDVEPYVDQLGRIDWHNEKAYRSLLEMVKLRDGPALGRLAEKVSAHLPEGESFYADLDQWLVRAADSATVVLDRRSIFQPVEIDTSLKTDLPIQSHLDEIQGHLGNHQVVIVAGETGSGKTTQLPKLLLKMGFGCRGRIGHTQPRRLAARTVATRIAGELDTSLGQGVGYRFRFESSFSDTSRVLLMTDGLLLAEIERDRLLLEYDALIIDEAHERSLNIDFLLGYLKTLLPKRPDFRLIVTSATIDVDRFASHFNQAPVVQVEGRSYPVNIEYPEESVWGAGSATETDAEGQQAELETILDDVEASVTRILQRIEEGEREGDYSRDASDVLIFLPGEREIRDLRQALAKSAAQERYEVIPLYARLSREEQNKLFNLSPGKRRIVLATNVAETSVTVPNIGYVIDSGVARISRYSFNSRLQRLQIEKISQASASQRAGRCGRVAAGVCFRLYSQLDFDNRPEFTDPEIKRTQLADVILKMQVLRLGDINRFPFIEAPSKRQIKSGINTLRELGAISSETIKGEKNNEELSIKINSRGRALARLPVDSALASMLVSAKKFECLPELIVIVSALSIVDPREHPEKKKQHAEQMHARFKDVQSDFLSYLNLWLYVEEARVNLSASQFRKLCKKEYFSWSRLREWRNMYRQLRLSLNSKDDIVTKASSELDEEVVRRDWTTRYEAIHRSLIPGLYQKFGRLDEGGVYRGARDGKFFIAPGNAGFKKKTKWVIASEIVETRKVYARVVASIKKEWLAQELTHLLRYEYGDPVWDKKRGQVSVPRTSRLFGIVVASNEFVACETIDASLAREVFIREALALRDLGGDRRFLSTVWFWTKNEAILDKVTALEDRLRQRDETLGNRYLEAFYESRLPPSICSRKSLHKHYSNRESDDQRRLLLSEDDIPLLTRADEAAQRFPPSIMMEGESYKLQYSFAPGALTDGVSCLVPESHVHGLRQEPFEWLVPGLLEEKIAAMIKLLPKQQRRSLVPVPTHSSKLTALVESKRDQSKDYYNLPSLYQMLQLLIKKHYGVDVDPVSWRELCEAKLDPFYFIRIKVVGGRGKLLAEGRQFSAVKDKISEKEKPSVSLAKADKPSKKAVHRNWCFDAIGKPINRKIDGKMLRAYPVMESVLDGVVESYELEAPLALLKNQKGLLRLASVKLSDTNRYLKKQLYRDDKKLLGFSISTASKRFSKSQLVETTIAAAIGFSCFDGFTSGTPETPDDYDRLLEKGRAEVVSVALQIESIVIACAEEYSKLVSVLATKRKHFDKQAKDIEQQIDLLLGENFIVDTPFARLSDLPRYLRGINVRLDRLGGNYKRDEEYREKLSTYQQNLLQLLYKYPDALNFDVSLVEFRWMLEELRVALFAQQLKTAKPASFKRLDASWEKVDMLVYS